MQYDVFISSKSEDYHLAEGIYEFLKKNGLSVFIASIELQKIGKSQYADAIDKALDDSIHMIVVASSLNNINSKWVKYEWSTFSNDIKSGYRSGNLLTILSNSIELKNLPASLRHQQSFHFDSYKNGLLDYLSTPQSETPSQSIACFNFYSNTKCQIFLEGKNIGTTSGERNTPYQLPVFRKGLFRFKFVNVITKKTKTIKENIEIGEEKDIVINWEGQTRISRIYEWILSKEKIILITLGCTFIIALGWMFFPQIISIFNNDEARAWRAAKQENTFVSYASFIENEKNSNGKHVEEALRGIMRLNDDGGKIEKLYYVWNYSAEKLANHPRNGIAIEASDSIFVIYNHNANTTIWLRKIINDYDFAIVDTVILQQIVDSAIVLEKARRAECAQTHHIVLSADGQPRDAGLDMMSTFLDELDSRMATGKSILEQGLMATTDAHRKEYQKAINIVSRYLLFRGQNENTIKK